LVVVVVAVMVQTERRVVLVVEGFGAVPDKLEHLDRDLLVVMGTEIPIIHQVAVAVLGALEAMVKLQVVEEMAELAQLTLLAALRIH
jgi:hypothetical protein